MYTIEEVMKITKNINFIMFKKNYSHIKKTGLYPGQPELLKILIDNEGISIRKLARITKKEPATITKSIQRLEASGYIKKISDPNDKRIIKIYVTDLGKKISKEINDILTNELKLYKNILSKEEIDTLYNILHKIEIGLEGEENERNI